MKFTSLFTCALMSLSATGALAQVCEWYLNPDDCICMLSTDGSLLRTQTTSCCKKLGYKTMNSVCSSFLPFFFRPLYLLSILDNVEDGWLRGERGVEWMLI